MTDSRSFCFGGEVPILVYDAKHQAVTVIDGQGAAPRLATLDHFKGPGGIPAKGIEAAAVPAALDACLTLLDRFGTMTFTQVIAPTQDLLRHRPRPEPLACRSRPHARDPGRRRGPEAAAATARRPRRQPTAREGCDWSPTRSIADRSPVASMPGRERTEALIRYVDLATHTTRIEEPVAVNYRGLTVYKCGPWTQGPYLLEALQILDGFDLKAMGHNRPDAIHTIVETIKLALADRDTYYADPHFADVPLAALLSPGVCRHCGGS